MLLMVALLIAPIALAGKQFDIVGTGYSMLPGPNSRAQGLLMTGYITTVPGGYSLSSVQYMQDPSLETETYGIGTIYAMPFWKFLVGAGINAVKWDAADDSHAADDYFGGDLMVTFFPKGIENSRFGFTALGSYNTSIQRVTVVAGITVLP
jgi:hypothetical protein